MGTHDHDHAHEHHHDHDDHDHDDHDHEHEHDHEHAHDHEGHDHETPKRLHDELLAVIEAVGEHFGDREPTEEELRDFLRQRLAEQGRSEEDIEEIMREL